jgi:hypothetical protein
MSALGLWTIAAPFREPPIPQPPNDPTSLLLNGQVGWRAQRLDGVAVNAADGALMLPISSADARALTEPSGSFGGLRPPGNVAIGPDGSTYLLDRAKLALRRFDPCTCEFETIPCIGGEGGGGREWRDPHGIEVCGADLYVCDTGLTDDAASSDPCIDAASLRARLRAENHRVSVFALKAFVLRGHLQPPRSHYPYWEPFAVAFDARRRMFVTDAANDVVHRFDGAGRWEQAMPGFPVPSYIAVLTFALSSPCRLDGSCRRSVNNRSPARARLRRWRHSFAPLPLRVEPSGVVTCPAMPTADPQELAAARTRPVRRARRSVDPQTRRRPHSFSSPGVYASAALDGRFVASGTGSQRRHSGRHAVVVRTFTPKSRTPLRNRRSYRLAHGSGRGGARRDMGCLVRSGIGRYSGCSRVQRTGRQGRRSLR